MKEIALEISNLSKQYRLGQVGSKSLSDDLKRLWFKIRGLEDPFSEVGQVNDRRKEAKSNYVWALKDISFKVKKGEILGLVGSNGAGKSTLLKLISQITTPSSGQIKASGRIASLLEVGTGMNLEMTAKENIYLNGAILGMTKKEISNKFDEIVDFSGCVMYIDTPIKRFSSGMRVRLGFAVAAFLEPEILIVDEVLAVGDAEFQKKAIGKMKNISAEGGRTVLFVSHNMKTIQSLCDRCILMENGMVKSDGETNAIIKEYIGSEISENKSIDANSIKRRLDRYGMMMRIIDVQAKSSFYYKENIVVTFSNVVLDSIYSQMQFGITINDLNGQSIFTYECNNDYDFESDNKLSLKVQLTEPTLIPGTYYISIGIRSGSKTLDHVPFVKQIEILQIDKDGVNFGFNRGGELTGYVSSQANIKVI